jgi:hypothetical protein
MNPLREITARVLTELFFLDSRVFKNVFPRKVQLLKESPKSSLISRRWFVTISVMCKKGKVHPRIGPEALLFL